MEVRSLASRYFKPEVVNTVKLHYHPLIQNAPPYNRLSGEDRLRLADGMFQIICNSPCKLLSVTIDLEEYYNKYGKLLAVPKAYAMLMMLERFQDFLEPEGLQGVVIYERFNRRERRRIEVAMKALQGLLRFRHRVELNNIVGKIRDGDPLKEPILQLADFFAYATQIKYRTGGKKSRRWESIKMKYYNHDGGYYYSGNVFR